VPIVRLKTLENNRKINELISRFTFALPPVSTKGYESKPRPELTGGSAINGTEAYKIMAVQELLKRTIIR
jgi:hypothetical protein